ncbi:MAG: MAPEG family protein [Acetobacteraceae bacterium]
MQRAHGRNRDTAMTFALWTILAAAVLPYLCTAAAKYGGSGYDNANPRPSMETLRGWRARADWAHRNHFEAFAPFAAAVLTAHFVHAPQFRIDTLAGAFLLVRVAYTAAYILNRPALRSALFFAGFLCIVGLFCATLV